MKKRAVGILVGVMVSSMLLSACGSNEAKEAASESAQVEEEGTGERTEEGEKVFMMIWKLSGNLVWRYSIREAVRAVTIWSGLQILRYSKGSLYRRKRKQKLQKQ